MKFRDINGQAYLHKQGWLATRKVSLPSYIEQIEVPNIVTLTIENLYKLELTSISGKKRKFVAHENYLRDFDEIILEHVEDTGLNTNFYPLGHMSEYGGIMVLDKFGRFYLAGDSLIYFGSTLEEFFDVVIFRSRVALHILDDGETRFGYNYQNTGFKFDAQNGWLGTSSHLYKDYIFGEEDTKKI